MSDGAGDKRPGGAGGSTRIALGALLGAIVGLLLWALVLRPGTVTPAGEASSASTAAASTAATATSADTASAATTASTAPAPAPAPAPTPPSFDTVRVDPNGSVLVAGRADPGATVDLRVDGTIAGTATADASGNFAAFLTLPPSGKPRVLSMVTRAADGTEVLAAADVVLQPTQAPAPTAVAAAEPAATAAADTSSGAPAPTATETPAPAAEPSPAANAAPPLVVDAEGVTTLATGDAATDVRIGTIGYDEAGAVDVSGEGRSGGSVRLYVDSVAVATVPVSSEGRWRAKLDTVAPGVHTLRADQIDDSGKVISRAETPFQREDPSRVATAAPALDQASGASGTKPRTRAQVVTVQPGFTLWAIARDTYGSGVLYVKVFDANKDQIRNPDLIYPGQVFTLPDGG